MLKFAALVALALSLVSPAWAHAGQDGELPMQGVVVDSSGAPVPGALVRVQAAGNDAGQATTGPDGRFALSKLPAGDLEVTASAAGFADTHARVSLSSTVVPVRLVLHPPTFADSVTVTGSRGAARLDTPNASTVLTSAELANTAAGALDDALRLTPGFSLFRRSSSRVANPTTQGVTLRGVSGSGASRTVVLADGEPLNDPFGSWVYWNRVPQAAIDRVEVVRGATGDLYGADALGGVVQVLTFVPTQTRLRATLDGGSHDTGRASVYGGTRVNGWTFAGAGEWVTTDGVFVIAPDDRGSVDTRADSDYSTGFGAVGYQGRGWHGTGRASAYTEDRGNGTVQQVNSTDWHQFSTEFGGSAGTGVWSAHLAGGTQEFFQTFTAVAADRNSERLTTSQRTPSTFTTFGGQFAMPVGRHSLLVGADGKRTESTVNETRYAFATGAPSGPFLFGGTETNGSIYGRLSLVPTDRLTIGVGGRGDFWTSDPLDGAAPAHEANFFSPRVSATFRATPLVSLQGSVYRAYRTPTLNELYRGFRVGNIVTSANAALEPERLTGVEGGVLFERRRFSGRVTGFFNHLDDAITNITLSVTPALIQRERQNADRIRAAGVEIETDFRPNSKLTLNALAVFTASNFLEAVKQPDLEGNRVPQVPTYQLGFGATWTDPHIVTASADLRVIGEQFDDDQNQFELGAFAVVDLYAGRSVTRGLNAFLAIENLFDQEYDTGKTPIRTIGWPRTVRAGVRIFLP